MGAIAAAWTWFLGTPVGKALGWIGAGMAAAAVVVVGYLRWRAEQRSVGAAGAVAAQKQADQEIIDHAQSIEDRNRLAGAESARDGLRKYAGTKR
jgi:hypothetical protein